jgi:thiol:disulfide interchange protein DsbD
MIKTVGDKWSTFQAENFGSVSQPQYVIISPEEELLNRPVGYSNAKEYTDWLKCGIKAYKRDYK